jgi:predicted ferric reductase
MEFSVAIGYAGLAMIGLQFGLTARFRYVTDPWGEDVIYHFHRPGDIPKRFQKRKSGRQ